MTDNAWEMAGALYVALVAVGFTRWIVGMAQRAYLLYTMPKNPQRPAPDAKKKGGERAAGS